MLLNLSHGKQDFFKEIVESFANKSGSLALFDSLFESGTSRERSFIGTDDIGNVSTQAPVQIELHKYDIGKKCYFLKLNTTLCTRTSSANTCARGTGTQILALQQKTNTWNSCPKLS